MMPACARCGIGRREFLERTLTLLGASALAACGASIPSAPAITAITVKLSDYPALANVGGIAMVDDGSRSGEPIAVSRTGTSTFVALSLVCPHRGFTVEVIPPGFYCPGHGATFAANGAWTGGQSTSSLTAYHSVYDAASDTLQIS